MKSFGAAIALVFATAGVAPAMPAAPAAAALAAAPIVLVRDGCGPGFHRAGPGECVPNGGRVGPRVVEPIGPRVVEPVRLPPPCPRGYYRDPRPGVPLCYPRF